MRCGAVEVEIIAHMATGKIQGQETNVAYLGYAGADSGMTAKREADKLLMKLDIAHASLGLIKGEQSKKQYAAELDKAAQTFVEANYPDRSR